MTKKQQNNSIKAAAILLCMPVEKLEELLDIRMTLSVCQTEKRQIADMYKKLYEENEKLETAYANLRLSKWKNTIPT